jgi:AcrR family transcriptional regulator
MLTPVSEVPAPFTTGAQRRRAPFGDNPEVGTRGAWTQERILRAALEVFAEVGYHDTGIDRIASAAKCSRPTFYQYFASKEELFHRLSGDLARQLLELAAQPEPITPDEDGWKALRAYVDAYAALHEVYAPVFGVFSTVVASDDLVAAGAAKVLSRQAVALIDRIDRRAFRTKAAHDVTLVLLNGLTRTLRYWKVLEDFDGTGLERDRVHDALADVLHRSFFGASEVNVREEVPVAPVDPPPAGRRTTLTGTGIVPGQAGRRTRRRLLEVGREVFASRGYHDTRVDDIADAAEVSHGTFYRYFDSKQALFRILAARSGLRVASDIDDLPVDAGTAALRRWLRGHVDVYAAEAPIIRAWIEAEWGDPELWAESPVQVEAMRARVAALLAPRRYGDVDADALVLLALLDRSEPVLDGEVADDVVVDAYVHILQRALLPTAGPG